MRYITIILFILLLPIVYGNDYLFPLTYSIADARYCRYYGDCTLNNLTLIGSFFNVSVINFNVTGDVNAYNFLINGTPISSIYVPYENATRNVNLGNKNLTMDNGTISWAESSGVKDLFFVNQYNADGFKAQYWYDFEAANDDWMMFVKTDGNDDFVDGGIGFVMRNQNGINTTVFTMDGIGHADFHNYSINSSRNITAQGFICDSNGCIPNMTSYNESMNSIFWKLSGDNVHIQNEGMDNYNLTDVGALNNLSIGFYDEKVTFGDRALPPATDWFFELYGGNLTISQFYLAPLVFNITTEHGFLFNGKLNATGKICDSTGCIGISTSYTALSNFTNDMDYYNGTQVNDSITDHAILRDKNTTILIDIEIDAAGNSIRINLTDAGSSFNLSGLEIAPLNVKAKITPQSGNYTIGGTDVAHYGTGLNTCSANSIVRGNTANQLTCVATSAIAGTFPRATGAGNNWGWSNMQIANSCTANDVITCGSTNSISGATNLEFDGNTLKVSGRPAVIRLINTLGYECNITNTGGSVDMDYDSVEFLGVSKDAIDLGDGSQRDVNIIGKTWVQARASIINLTATGAINLNGDTNVSGNLNVDEDITGRSIRVNSSVIAVSVYTQNMTITNESALKLTGNATVWNDIVFPSSNLKINPLTSKPDEDAVNVFYLFDDTNTECLHGSGQTSHTQKNNTALSCHVHWEQSASGNVNWTLNYSLSNLGQTSQSWIEVSTTTPFYAYSSGDLQQQSDLPDTTAIAGSGLSSILRFQICRVGSGTGDNMVGDAKFESFDCHYEIDSLGSATEFSK